MGCFFLVFPKQTGRRELFLKFLSSTFGRPHFGRVCQVVRSTRFFSGKWAFVGPVANSRGGSSLKIFSGKRGPPIRCPNSVQRASSALFRKVALGQFWAGTIGPALLFSEVFPRRLELGWLKNLVRLFI